MVTGQPAANAVTYSVFESGNLVRSSTREDEIVEAFDRIVAETPADEHDRLQLVAFDAAGRLLFDCAPGERIAQTA